MMATPTSRPRMPAVCRSRRVHVHRHRIAFAVVGGVGDLDVVEVDVVAGEALVHRAHETDRGVAAAEGGDVVALGDEARCRCRRRRCDRLRSRSCRRCRWPAPRRIRRSRGRRASYLSLSVTDGRARRRRGAAVDSAVAAEDQAIAAACRASRWKSCRRTASCCRSARPSRRTSDASRRCWRRSWLRSCRARWRRRASSPVALGVICLTPAVSSTLACWASVSVASTASMTPSRETTSPPAAVTALAALSVFVAFDDVAVRVPPAAATPAVGVPEVAEEHDTSTARPTAPRTRAATSTTRRYI